MAKLLVLFLALEIAITESRVFCEDSQATQWRPLGFSCPITCRIILSAVERLQQIDYQNLINLQSDNSFKPAMLESKKSKRTPEENILDYKPVHKNVEGLYAQTYEAFVKIVQTEQFFADFKLELSNLTDVLNVTCYIVANETRLLQHVLNECTINKPKGYILKRFMAFLNKYADSEYGFNTAMTLIILKHLLNTSNFRYGMMEAILLYMKSALKPEDGTLAKEDTIKLTSKDCLSMFVPGCFCNKGYVERQGRCVTPKECSEDPMIEAFLHRIKIF